MSKLPDRLFGLVYNVSELLGNSMLAFEGFGE